MRRPSAATSADRRGYRPGRRRCSASRWPRLGFCGRNGGPYITEFSRPLAASIASRRASASSRIGRRCQSRRLSGSAADAGRIAGRRLSIDRARDDQPMDWLEPPAAADELACQPFEQLGMVGTVARCAEVVGRAHQALAEMVLPEPVDNHSRQQAAGAVVDVGEPPGQRHPLVGRAEHRRSGSSNADGTARPTTRACAR